jgi:hypothetical protein
MRSTPFGILENEHGNFLVERLNAPSVVPNDAESYPSRRQIVADL